MLKKVWDFQLLCVWISLQFLCIAFIFADLAQGSHLSFGSKTKRNKNV